MSPIKDLDIIYQVLNEDGTFSAGDTIIGTVTFTLTKGTKLKSLFVKAKGDARVHWSEGTGDNKQSYSAHKRYFKVKEYLLEENGEGNNLQEGEHHFKFSLRIPHEDMPPSFKGANGSIIYALEAKVSRSWRWPSTARKELNLVSKSFPYIDQALCPQSGSVNKDVGVFSKGEVQMSASVNRKACSPGDTLSVFAQINNSSSKQIKPKFSLEQKTVYRAGGSTHNGLETLFKMVCDPIEPDTEETASCSVTVPDTAIYSLHNCDILSVEYQIKVYLDISFAVDPEVVFPLVIVPPSFPGFCEDVETYPTDAMGAPSGNDFPAAGFPIGVYPVPSGSDACAYPTPQPTQQTNITNGYNDQGPQNPTQYGFTDAVIMPPSVQYPSPAVPPQYEQGQGSPS
ncbi:arrestin domain-containing protein 3-like [Cololabis saira]|uniref:arrestin domain-containing protein 3-like n=1 Tax=Cololabis saira TaxID=129043 RepID=UPI002AD47198|nr:arrestin domain-containing protein 3-like [Cololabis saira]